MRNVLPRLAALGGVLCLGWSLAPSAPARNSARVLVGRSGRNNGYVITLSFADGRKVRTLPAGTYTFVIHDYSRIHNFALGSQTANKRLLTTGIPWVGTRSYTLRLAPGSYAYACSAHFRTMNGKFVVTAG